MEVSFLNVTKTYTQNKLKFKMSIDSADVSLDLRLSDGDVELEVEAARPRGSNLKSDTHWVILKTFKSDVELETFIRTYTHKMTSTHGNQVSKCIYHDMDEKHKQTYGYYKCTSSKCHKETSDKCSFEFRVNKCSLDQCSRLYQVGDHSNKYSNEVDNKRPGICMFYKAEIDKLFADEANKTPYAIRIILIKRRAEGMFGYFLSFCIMLYIVF